MANAPPAHLACKTCGKAAPDAAFYPGRLECKACAYVKSKAWRAANPEKVRAARLAHAERTRDVQRLRRREYKTRNRARLTAEQREFRASHPERRKAWDAIEKAVTRGHIIRPDNCQKCGRHKGDMRIEASHHDYSKPLDVEWLCVRCHRAKDAAMREASSHHGARGKGGGDGG